MSSFTVLLFCTHACLVQACLGAYGPASPMLAAPGWAYDRLAYPVIGFAGVYPAASCGAGHAPYGGGGEGNVAVAGELPVIGTTAIAGQVPIMGTVGFRGPVAAAGVVFIAGKCACGCGTPYDYYY